MSNYTETLEKYRARAEAAEAREAALRETLRWAISRLDLAASMDHPDLLRWERDTMRAALSSSPPSGAQVAVCPSQAEALGPVGLLALGEVAAAVQRRADGWLSPEAAERIAEGMRTLRDQREPHDDGQGGDVEQDPDCWCARCVAVRTIALLEGHKP